MTPAPATVKRPQRSRFFQPRLWDLQQGYTPAQFWRDLAAGIAVGIVALPLAMAFAIASGLKPEAGLFTAIIAGFLISALGGSRVQIGGPAGAFIVIIYGILERYGLANLILATAMSGVMLFAMGFFKLGTLVRFIPVAVILGFTNGIAVLIALSQVKDFLGLQAGTMPANFFGLLGALAAALPSINPAATLLASAALALIVAWQLGLPRLAATRAWAGKLALLPGTVIALIAATAVAWWWQLPVETIGSRFGGIPAALPAWTWPDFSWETARFLLIPATTLALLGAIESLLCARVADGMIDDRHNPNQELMAQGIANFITPFFGGMPATGTIARTVTNVKSGGRSPIAGMVHALTLLLIVLVAAPLAQHIPLAAMAAILMFVAWNMGEWREFVHLRQFRLPYRITLLAVFLLTVVVDLTVAVEVGLIAACITFIYRISSLSRRELVNIAPLPGAQTAGPVTCYRFYGALFFGAVQLVEELREELQEDLQVNRQRAGAASMPRQSLVLDLKNLIYVDSSGADALLDLARACRKSGVHLVVCGLNHQPLDIAKRCGLVALLKDGGLAADLEAALALAWSASPHSPTHPVTSPISSPTD